MRRRMGFSCSAFRCGGIWRAKLSRFCTICLVRCASCRITRRSLRALSGSSGFSISRSAKPRIAVSGLLTSCATPETSCPTAAIFSACISLDCRLAASVTSVITTTMLVTCDCSSRMGLRLTEKWPILPSPRRICSSRLSTWCPARVALRASVRMVRRAGATRSSRGSPSNCFCS